MKRIQLAVVFALQLLLLSQIQANASDQNIVTVGLLENWPPQYSYDKESTESSGFAVDIMNEVAKLSGLKVRYKVFPTWPKLNRALRAKEIDVIPNMGITDERTALFYYTEPVETTNIRFFIRSSAKDIENIKDLNGRTASVVETNKGRYLMEERNWEHLKIYQSLEEALMSVLSGSSDLLVYPDPPMNQILRRADLDERIIPFGKPLLEIKRGMAVHKDNEILAKRLNTAVLELLSLGVYKRIHNKYYGIKDRFWLQKQTIYIVLVVFSSIIILLLFWRFISIHKIAKNLKKTIEQKKKAEEVILKNQYYLVKSQEMGTIGTWELDLRKNNLSWTDENYKIFGVPIGTEMNYELFLSCVHPKDREYVDKQWTAALEKVPYDIEHRVVINGKEKWVREKAEVEFDDNDSAIRAIGFTQDITERKLFENRIVESEERFRTLFENMNTGFVLFEPVLDKKGKPIDLIILAANKGLAETTGLKLEQVEGKHLTVVLPGIEKDEADWIGTYGGIALSGESKQFEAGSELLGYYYTVMAYQAGPNQCAVTFLDITDRKKAEQQIKTALNEKETLLHELYHRTKNNMQVISSMLMLSAAKYPSEQVRDMVKETENKIESMALVHQMLYQSKDLSHIGLDDYISRLTDLILRSYNLPKDKVQVLHQVEKIDVLIDTAVPFGLVINELMSNSIKHAFPGDRNGTISLQVDRTSEGTITFEYSDDGVGIHDHSNLQQSNSLGVRLITGIVEQQMNGSLNIQNTKGLTYTMEISDKIYDTRV